MTDNAASPTGAVLWSVRRPPGRPLLIFASFLGLLFALVSVWLVRHLVAADAWILGIGVGLFLGLLVPMSIARGASCRVHDGGQLVYGYGRRDDLIVDLAAITLWARIDAGLLRGIGADCEPQQVRFLHRKGLSYSKMADYRRGLGTSLVLEFLTQTDLDELRRLQEELTGKRADVKAPPA